MTELDRQCYAEIKVMCEEAQVEMLRLQREHSDMLQAILKYKAVMESPTIDYYLRGQFRKELFGIADRLSRTTAHE